jgi:RND family efflux transporter MFP subunit
MKEIDEIMTWPGTVRARTVAEIAPKIAARVVEITVKAGDAVKAGQVLAKLDQRELQSRLGQARSALAAAQAQAARAAADARRTQNLFDKEAATQQSLEAAQAAARTASAQVAEARSAIGEAESLFGETALRAPFDGVVVKRRLEPGDMALPGSPVLVLQSAQRLRVEAAIPESCARSIQKGETLRARIAEQEYVATVEEIAPAADPQTRTVLVKAGIQDQGSAQPGAFAWIAQACGQRHALLIPASAVSRAGQLESVRLIVDGRALLRHVRTGKLHDGLMEILSGLKAGDVVLVGDER